MQSRRYLPILLLLFIGSGCAALIYEVVWFQLLEMVVGSSALSMGLLLGTFMAGMCLGSLLLPHVISQGRHPLRVYAWLELGIGAIGLVVLFGMPFIGGVYSAWAGPGALGMTLRVLAIVVCLLPPTLLMGATLPAVSRWVETTSEGVSWLGFFYGGNIGGAVLGSLLAGFYLLREFDTTVATFVAVALNVLVAVLGLLIASLTGTVSVRTADARDPAPPGLSDRGAREIGSPGRWVVYVAIALSGMTALAAEVVWTRVLSLLFGGTVYTFSLILAVFLVGLGIGSSLGSAIGRGLERPRVALGICQLLLCAAIAWTSYMLTESLPFWPINPSMAATPWYTMQLDLVRTLWAVLPGAILWGMSFPLALASVATPGQDPGRLVGGVYAANTVGAIVGALGASFFLVASVGTQHAHQMLIIICLFSGALVLTSAPDVVSKSRPAGFGAPAARRAELGWGSALLLIGTAGVALLLVRGINPLPGVLVAYGRYAAMRVNDSEYLYVGEGTTASVAVTRLKNTEMLNYHNAGKVQASSEPQDMRLQRMLGHLTTLVPRQTKTVVVIGCGAGVTAGAVSIDPAVEHETIAEIEPLVP
jgi:spermidine synthase